MCIYTSALLRAKPVTRSHSIIGKIVNVISGSIDVNISNFNASTAESWNNSYQANGSKFAQIQTN
jgi:hypothetical protein